MSDKENHVIASVLIAPHLMVSLNLKPEHFSVRANQAIYAAFKNHGVSVEIATAACEGLVPDKNAYVMEIMDAFVSPVGVEANATLVKSDYARARITQESKQFLESLKGTASLNDLVPALARTITELSTSGASSSLGDTSTIMDDLDEFSSTAGAAITFGIDGLEIRRGELIVPAARPGCGKSALVLQMAQEIGQHGPVLMFCGEMPRRQVWLRAMSQYFRRMVKPEFTTFNTFKTKYAEWARANLQMTLDDKDCIDIDELVSKAHAEHYKKPLDLIVVDYLQKVRCSYTKDRFNQVTEVAIRLKKLARDLDVPVVAPAQLNRELEGKPLLKHLRDSGQIEQEADQVWLMSGADDNHNPVARVNLEKAKYREGATGDIFLEFDKPCYTMRLTV